MSKLFVADDEEDSEKYYDVKSEDSAEHELIDDEDDGMNGDGAEAFDGDDDDDDDDEIINEIPIHLSHRIENLCVLQYPNRTKEAHILNSRLKKTSGLIELEIPLDTSKFFDVEKSNEWNSVRTQTLKGVMNENEIYYIGAISNNKDKDGKAEITLTPLDRTVQLRPSLKYIDDASIARKARQQQAMNSNNHGHNSNDDYKKNEVKMIQMSVKSASESGQQRLSGALQASKTLDEEPYVEYDWKMKNDTESEALRQKLHYDTTLEDHLESTTTGKQYIDLLFNETIQ